jgi:hypothetical protein
MEVPNRCLFAFIAKFGICTPWLDLFDEVSSSPNKYHMQTLCAREVDVSTTLIGAHKPFVVSSSGFRVLSFMIYVKNSLGASF